MSEGVGVSTAAVKASVVVATRNRAEPLRVLLSSLREISPPSGGWELLVVDNGSVDTTSAVLSEAADWENLPLIAIKEPVAGKPVALNAALSRARGELIAFTDDDCVVPSDWLVSIVREFDAYPGVDVLGGKVELQDPSDESVAVRTSTARRFMRSPTELYGFIIGCNMAMRRSTLDVIGRFDPMVGPGAPIPSGNDIDIVYRAFLNGSKIMYSPTAVLYHAHGRATPDDVARVRRRYTIGRGAFYAKYSMAGDRAVLWMGAREVRGSIRRLLRTILRGRLPCEEVRQLTFLASGFSKRLWLSFLKRRSA